VLEARKVTNMTVEEFIAKNGVTQCAPAHAQGNEAKSGLRRHVAEKRKAWSVENKQTLAMGTKLNQPSMKQEAA